MKHILPLILFLLIISPSFLGAITVEEKELELRLREVAKKLRCTVCQNESIWESNAELARQMKGIIRERLEQGQSPQEIENYFLSRYGDYILLKPQKRGLNWLLWAGPFVLLFLGGFLLYRTLGRWVRESQQGRSDAIPPIDESSRKRIDQELRSFRK